MLWASLASSKEEAKAMRIRLSGNEWQEYANQLLSTHYGPADYQRIPDTHRGDAGLEGFTRKDGHAYQAYGVVEPVDVKTRYERQRDKLTEDVDKFIKNRAAIAKLLGTVKITRWCLFVPECASKDLVAHTNIKTAEVIRAALPYVAASFFVHVCEEDAFADACNQLLKLPRPFLQIAPSTPKVDEWAAGNDTLVTRLDKKLIKLPTLQDDARRERYRRTILKWLLEFQEILHVLRGYPEVYQEVMTTIAAEEELLVLSSLNVAVDAEVLKRTVAQLRDAIDKHVPRFHFKTADGLALGGVADWLVRCPLDFPEALDV